MFNKRNIREYIIKNKDNLINMLGMSSMLSFALALCEGLVSCVAGHNNYQAPYLLTCLSLVLLFVSWYIENEY